MNIKKSVSDMFLLSLKDVSVIKRFHCIYYFERIVIKILSYKPLKKKKKKDFTLNLYLY